jgi:hypothetical protein
MRRWFGINERGTAEPVLAREANVNLAIVRKALTGAAPTVVLLMSACGPAQEGPNSNLGKTAVLHATITITGGVAFTGSFDNRLAVPTCADVAKGGTIPPGSPRGAIFAVPVPNTNATGNNGSVGGGHTYQTDAFAWPYNGPATYTGKSMHATSLSADRPPNTQDTHVFGYPFGVGTLIVNPDASGSFQFNGLKDVGSVMISGQITWTCS